MLHLAQIQSCTGLNIIGTLLAVVTTSGLHQNVCYEYYVRITVSYSNFHDRTNSIVKIPEGGMQLSEWQVTLLLYA